MFRSKKWLLILVLVLLSPMGYFLFEWQLAGGGLKRIVYNFYRYDDNNVRVVEDHDFLFNKQGYSKTYDLKSDYYVAHRILLIPESKSIPISFDYSGEVLIEIFDKDNDLLQSTKVDRFNSILRRKEGDDYYGNYLIYGWKSPRDAGSIFAFELGEIPFDLIRLRKSRLKNMRIKITVTKPEEGLEQFCDNATLVIIPDLRL